MIKKNVSVFVLLNLAAVSAPIFIAGCGSAAPATTAQVVAASNGTGTSTSSNSSSSGSGSTSGSGSSSSSTSGSGSSSTSGSGSSTSSSSGTTSGSSNSGSTSGSGSSGATDQVPATALAVNKIQSLTNWDGTYDTATGSSSSGSNGQMSLTGSPSRSGSAREFVTDYTNGGGERYWVSFGADTASTNFFYDGWIYIASPSNDIANLELDMNQVISNGKTVIYGFQCDGYSGTWDYTSEQPTGHWVHSTAACNPRKWSTDTWHHVQIEYSRDDVGNVTYKAVWLDGTEQDINKTVMAADPLGWSSGTLLTNFQVDGIGTSGKATVYLDDLTISRW